MSATNETRKLWGSGSAIMPLMQFLTKIKKLCEEFDCKNLFGFNGYELQNKIYAEVAKQAKGG